MNLQQVDLALTNELHRLSEREGGWVIDNDNEPCLRRVAEWIHGRDYRRGFTLRGPVGTGKSRVVEAAGRVLMVLQGKGIRRIEAVELVNIVARAKGDRSVLEKYADPTTYPFLWIEDIGTEGNAPSFVTGDGGINCVAELLQVRYKRWEQGLPLTTGFTTNLDNSQLLSRYLERCCSRMNHLSFVIPLKGPDRRAQNAALPTAQKPKVEAPPASDEVAAAAFARIAKDLANRKSVRAMERAKERAQIKASYLDDMRDRVRRMDFASLHFTIQHDIYPEAREIALNHFNMLSPISYAQFVQELNKVA